MCYINNINKGEVDHVHTMKALGWVGGMEVELHLLLTFVLDGGRGLARGREASGGALPGSKLAGKMNIFDEAN